MHNFVTISFTSSKIEKVPREIQGESREKTRHVREN